ncbi:MAG: MBL fold metallo-hydrolase [Thermoanaerobaculales bacterium]|jgi:glyoxylase-like metal-dependent hydrolase (beta-lactamase superfamily II)|nr:MBL fold metallo-hydrolase [Thermoanaerobaculales bacterium]
MTEIQSLDLEFYGATELIASFLAPADGGFVLFDPGPASAVDTVERRAEEAGFRLEDLRAVFATHVHLDHAGGAGVLAQRTGCQVFCHPVGAPHLEDPAAKLLPSAERLYGDMMEPLWGTTVGVPKDQLRTVDDSEKVMIGGLEVIGWHTPGHAIHHVAWQIGDAVSTGDVAGVRFPGATHVLPPLPPPDIDVEKWLQSLAILRRLAPSRLLLTHFGAIDDPVRHIDELEERLKRWTEVARRVVSNGGDKGVLGVKLEKIDEEEMQASGVSPEAAERYRRLCPVKESSVGLFRYCSLENR